MQSERHPLALRQNAMLEALDRLPVEEKLVASLYLFEDLSLKHCAAAIRISASDARRRWARASKRVADEIGPYLPDNPLALDQWAGPEAKLCYGTAWSRFDKQLEQRYGDYFAARPALKQPDHDFSAAGYAEALAPGWEKLLERIPGSLHIHARSGKSSQVLALGLIGAAESRDDSLSWLWRALDLGPGPSQKPETKFEHELAPSLLNERGRATNVDYFVRTRDTIICLEAKWGEEGLGQCSCTRRPGNPFAGRCSPLRDESARPRYWEAGSLIFSLPSKRHFGRPCPISFAYQGIRNAAGALAEAGPNRRAVFVLIYNEDNPVFAGSGETEPWPGWASLLRQTVRDSKAPPNFDFRAVSWQDLMKHLPLDEPTRIWAHDKHGLSGPVERESA